MERAYRMLEVVGVSTVSYEDATKQAIAAAAKAEEHLAWFEVIEQRGRISGTDVAEYQVKVRIGARML